MKNSYWNFPNFEFRYRLVRHTWNLNVNESLNVDATCTLNNLPSDDLGIDVYIKNQNQVHHALVTEISIGDLKLFCPTFRLKADSVKCKGFLSANFTNSDHFFFLFVSLIN